MNPLDGTLVALKMIPRAQLHLYRDVLGCNPSQPQPGLPMPTPSGIVHLTIEWIPATTSGCGGSSSASARGS